MGCMQKDMSQALCKKIFDHRNSHAHAAAERILASAARNSLQEATDEINYNTINTKKMYKIQ